MRILVNNSQNSQMFKVGRHEVVLFPFGNKAPGNNYVVAVIDDTSGEHAKHIDRMIASKRLRVVDPAAICGLSTLNVALANSDGIAPLSNTTPIQAGIVSESFLRRDFAGLFGATKPAEKNEPDKVETVVIKNPAKVENPETQDEKTGSGEVVFNTGGEGKTGRATPLRR